MMQNRRTKQEQNTNSFELCLARRRKRTEVLNDNKKVMEMANRVFSVMQKRVSAEDMVAKLISILLTILNVGTIIWFTWNVSVEADWISNWSYEYVLCSDNSLFYIGVILRVIAFWGTVHLAHGIYHQIVLRKQI